LSIVLLFFLTKKLFVGKTYGIKCLIFQNLLENILCLNSGRPYHCNILSRTANRKQLTNTTWTHLCSTRSNAVRVFDRIPSATPSTLTFIILFFISSGKVP
jgi:hypothetical protein